MRAVDICILLSGRRPCDVIAGENPCSVPFNPFAKTFIAMADPAIHPESSVRPYFTEHFVRIAAFVPSKST